jgi:hypothetical protein
LVFLIHTKINTFIKQCKVIHLLQETAVPEKFCTYIDTLNFLRTQT